MEVIRFKRPPQRRRILRTYERLAQQQHYCCVCNRFIEPGEFYGAEVIAYNLPERKFITVPKWHIDPDCDPPWDEFEEFIEWAKDQEKQEEAESKDKAA